MIKIEVCNVPAREQRYSREVSQTVTFDTLEAALDFADRNDGKLFYLRPNVFAFQNRAHRTAEEEVFRRA